MTREKYSKKNTNSTLRIIIHTMCRRSGRRRYDRRTSCRAVENVRWNKGSSLEGRMCVVLGAVSTVWTAIALGSTAIALSSNPKEKLPFFSRDSCVHVLWCRCMWCLCCLHAWRHFLCREYACVNDILLLAIKNRVKFKAIAATRCRRRRHWGAVCTRWRRWVAWITM